MKKIVTESLFEFKQINEKEKISPAVVVKPKPGEKYKDAIDGLKKELAKAKKPGQFKTTVEKNAKIKELETKIKKFEDKSKS